METAQSNANWQFVPSSGKDERCVPHYKPNIWSYEYLESLVNDSKVDLIDSAPAEKLKEDLISEFDEATDASKLQMIDNMCKLGLSNLFKKEIIEALDVIASNLKMNPSFIRDVGTAALCFRLLRQHGYYVSQGLVTDFLDEQGAFKSTTNPTIKEVIELFETSHLALEDEYILTKGKVRSCEYLQGVVNGSDHKLGLVADTLGLPQHWRAQWFSVRQQIDAFDLKKETNSALVGLAKVNFKMVQAIHQRDLRDLSMWWRSLGLIQNISFARDRLVESFVCAVGVVPEPHYSCARKCITKVISFILVLDDIYDVYGSPDELECLTRAVDRWDLEETRQLPECMKICFSALYDTMNEIAEEIEKENGFHGALPCLTKEWAEFCKSMLTEARWYKQNYTPTLEEYLKNAWISSSGSLLSRAIYLSAVKKPAAEKLMTELQDLICHTSLIIRLCNDEATTAAELERGDSPSSIQCYMREANVSEEAARQRIKDMIASTWNKINAELLKRSPMEVSNVLMIMNAGRVAHCLYQTGDGFGVQDGHIKRQIKRMLIEPVSLD